MYVKIRLEDLPDSAEVTGIATMSGGYDFRGEKNSDSIVLEFRKELLGKVREKLSGKMFDQMRIDDIRFQ